MRFESDTPLVAASLLACDFGNLTVECQRAEVSGCDWLHLDVMDGHFVDNISFGPAFVAASRKSGGLPVDVHLMIERPDHYFKRFVKDAGSITVHVEASHDVGKTLGLIRESGCLCGLALNPATPVESVLPYVAEVDLILVMTVVPGFGGQSFLPDTMSKLRVLSQLRREKNLRFHLQVDGGINDATAKIAIENGANVLVAGSYLFQHPDMSRAVDSLRC